MKSTSKILCVIFCALMFSMGFSGCKKDPSVIRLCEVTHSTFYAPMYIAINNGYFEDEGLTIKLTNGGGANNVMTALMTDAADIGLLGPEATVYVQAQNASDYPIIFGQLTNCDGSYLMGRKAEQNFSWSNVKGKHILAGRAGGMPAMTLEYVINQANVATNELNFDTSVAFDLMAAAFENDDKYDYVTMFEPLATTYVNKGFFRITSIGQDSGAVPYTTFSASRTYLEKNPETIKKFLKAVMRGYDYMENNTPEVVADALLPSFTTNTKDELVATIVNYLAINAWKTNPIMLEEDFNRMQDILQNAGTLPNKADFNKIVDNSFAEELVAALA